MKLLLDQNLSPRLLTVVGDLYPGSTHVREVGLQAADDDTVWRYAAEHVRTPTNMQAHQDVRIPAPPSAGSGSSAHHRPSGTHYSANGADIEAEWRPRFTAIRCCDVA